MSACLENPHVDDRSATDLGSSSRAACAREIARRRPAALGSFAGTVERLKAGTELLLVQEARHGALADAFPVVQPQLHLLAQTTWSLPALREGPYQSKVWPESLAIFTQRGTLRAM